MQAQGGKDFATLPVEEQANIVTKARELVKKHGLAGKVNIKQL
jgi:hypothetical protein